MPKTIHEQLALKQTYAAKIDYLGHILEGVYEAVVALRSTYVDLAKKTYGHFTVACMECGNVHEVDKDVMACEACKSTRVAYGFGEPVKPEEKVV